MIEGRQGQTKLYKGHYFIVFYDETDEILMYMFDNVREILRYLNKPITRENVLKISKCICVALRTETHITRVIKGKPLRVYIIDTK